MNSAIAGLLLEAFLRAALKTSTTLRVMDAEGRKELTLEEEREIRKATDIAADLSRSIGDQL